MTVVETRGFARRHVVAGCLCHATAFGVLAAFASLVRPIAASGGIDRAAAAVITMTPVVVLLVLSRRAGRLSDLLGSGQSFAIGGVLSASALLAASVTATQAWSLLACGIPLGVGMAGLFVPSLRLVERSVTIPESRARALGLAAAGTSFGSLLLPPSAWIVTDHYGLKAGLAFLAGCSLLGAAAASALGDWSPPEDVPQRTRPQLGKLRLVSLLTACAYYLPLTHLPAAAQDRHASVPIVLILIGASNAAGRLGAAQLYRRVASFAIVVAASGLAVSMVVFSLAEYGVGAIYLAAIIYGAAAGVFVVVLPTLGLEISHANPGEVIGRLYQPMAVGALVGPALAGLSYEQFNSYAPAALAAAVLVAAAAAVSRDGSALRRKTP